MDIRRSDDKHSDERSQSGDSNKRSRGGSQSAQGGGTSLMGPLLLILGLIVLVGVGIFALGGGSGGAVATVNGEEISQEDFQNRLSQIEQQLNASPQQQQSVTEDRKRSAALQGLIDEELLVQAAEESGVSVSDSEIDSQLQSAGTSSLENVLGADATEAEKREYVRQQLLVQQYIESQAENGLTASDQEIQQFYDNYTSQIQQTATSGQEVPELSQLRPQIETAVQQQKRQQLASELLSEVRQSANVEVLIDGVQYPPANANAGNTTPQQQATTTPPSDSTSTPTESETSAPEPNNSPSAPTAQ